MIANLEALAPPVTTAVGGPANNVTRQSPTFENSPLGFHIIFI